MKIRESQHRNRRRGVIVWLVAGAMIMVLGFAALGVDYGVLAADRNQLQRGADAAALAGASKLPDIAAATQAAYAVAQENRVQNSGVDPVTTVNVTFPQSSQIRVTATRSRMLFFAKVVGVQTGATAATALAGPKAPAAGGIVPIVVTTDEVAAHTDAQGNPLPGTDANGKPLNETTLTLIRTKSDGLGTGNFMLTDLRDASGINGKAPPFMAGQLDGSNPAPVQGMKPADILAQNLTTNGLNGSLGDQLLKFLPAMASRFQAAAGPPWFDIDPNPSNPASFITYVGQHYAQILAGKEPVSPAGLFAANPRIMSLIVSTTYAGGGGNTSNPILAFVQVYIERVGTDAMGNETMTFRYLPSGAGGGGGGSSLLQ